MDATRFCCALGVFDDAAKNPRDQGGCSGNACGWCPEARCIEAGASLVNDHVIECESFLSHVGWSLVICLDRDRATVHACWCLTASSRDCACLHLDIIDSPFFVGGRFRRFRDANHGSGPARVSGLH